MKKATNQNGRSMVEMLGVLAIIGVLSTAGIAGYTKAMASYRANKLADQVQTVVANYIYYKETTKGGNELYNQQVINNVLLPPEMLDEDGNCFHALHGRCQISQESGGSDEFIIRFGDLDKDTCIHLLTLPYNGYTKLMTVNQVGENTVLSSGWGTRFTGVVSVSEAANHCEDEQNVVRWHF